MFDPRLTLAISLESNPGVYALLLGSGISQAAGIPTGWGIILDLVHRLAAFKGPEHQQRCKANPEAWYDKEFGGSLDYSKLLEDLASTQSERQNLIRGYFEPTDEERREGKKVPTKAHHAISKLVAGGFVRLIITTNFDRLLEDALKESHPHVISRPEGLHGAVPLVHSKKCTIVKIHGDYADTRIRNTNDELADYEPEVEKFLDRVFDEFGLLVCGWSATWDLALRTRLLNCQNHRYATYWAHRGTLDGSASQLVEQRRAKTIQISSADDFFMDLAERVTSIYDRLQDDVVTAAVAVRMLQRYLESDSMKIRLHRLIQSETERAFASISDERFDTSERVNASDDEQLKRLDIYEAETEVLRSLISEGVRWGTPVQSPLWIDAIKRVNKTAFMARLGHVSLFEMRRYPTLWLVYSVGVTALAFKRYDFLAELFSMKNPITDLKSQGANLLPGTIVILACQLQWGSDRTHGEDRNHYVSRRLFARLRDRLRGLIPDDDDYEDAFHGFEFLLALAAIFDGTHYYGRATPYQFPLAESGQRVARMLEQKRSPGRVEAEMEAQGVDWPGLKAGMFEGDWERVKTEILSLRSKFTRG